MASADLNFVQFYQPPTKASLTREKVPKASNAIAPTVLGEGKPPKAPRPSMDGVEDCGATIQLSS